MRIPDTKIKVTLEEAGQDTAVLTFNLINCAESERIMEVLEGVRGKDGETPDPVKFNAALRQYRSVILDKVTSVSGLEHADGSAVTVEDVRAHRLPLQIVERILAGFQAGAAARRGEGEEKNDPSPAEPSAG